MYDCITNNLLSWAISLTSFSQHVPVSVVHVQYWSNCQFSSHYTKRKSAHIFEEQCFKTCSVPCVMHRTWVWFELHKTSQTLTSVVWRIIYQMCLSGVPRGPRVRGFPTYLTATPPWISEERHWNIREKLTNTFNWCIDCLAGKPLPTFGARSIRIVWSSFYTWLLVRTLNHLKVFKCASLSRSSYKPLFGLKNVWDYSYIWGSLKAAFGVSQQWPTMHCSAGISCWARRWAVEWGHRALHWYAHFPTHHSKNIR